MSFNRSDFPKVDWEFVDYAQSVFESILESHSVPGIIITTSRLEHNSPAWMLWRGLEMKLSGNIDPYDSVISGAPKNYSRMSICMDREFFANHSKGDSGYCSEEWFRNENGYKDFMFIRYTDLLEDFECSSNIRYIDIDELLA